jgi:hypothetical protein
MNDIFIPFYKFAKKIYDDKDFKLQTFLYNDNIPYAFSYCLMEPKYKSVSYVSTYVSVKDYIKKYNHEHLPDFNIGMLYPYLDITFYYETNTTWLGDIGFVNPIDEGQHLTYFCMKRKDIYAYQPSEMPCLFDMHEDYIEYVYEDYDIDGIMRGMGIKPNNSSCKINNEMLKQYD